MTEQVTLIVPTKEKELSVVRLTTAGIAAHFDLDWETMADVKTAVYEACYAMTMQKTVPERLRLVFSLTEPFAVQIAGEGEWRETDGRLPELRLCQAVLETMIPHADITVKSDAIQSISLSR